MRRALSPLLLFEAAIGLLSVVALDPLLLILLQAVLTLSGDPFVGNTALVGFALSPVGAISIVTASVVAILLFAVEAGGICLIAFRARQGLPIRLVAIAATLLRRLPALIALSGVAFIAAAALVLFVAGVGLGAKTLLLSDADIYFYVTTRPPAFLLLMAVIVLAAFFALAAAVYLVARYGVAFPICLLHGTAALAGIRRSGQATAMRWRQSFLQIAAGGVALLALSAALTAVLALLYAKLLAQSPSLHALTLISIGFMVASFMLGGVLTRGLRVLLAATVLSAYLRSPLCGAVVSAPHAGSAPARGVPIVVRFAIGLALVALPIAQGIVAFAQVEPDRPVLVTAHRGGSTHAPENTLAALRQAIVDGADFAEIDVQETADGEIVLLHDTDLRRVAGVARSIWQVRYDEIKDLDVGSWFAPAFRDERIPTLREAIAVAHGHIRLNIELKTNGHEADLARGVVDILRESGAEPDAVVSSLDIRILMRVRALAPSLPVGLIVATGIGNASRLDVAFLALARRWATPGLIHTLRSSGREVHVWTLDDERSLMIAMLNGADNVITSDPRLAIRVRRWFLDLSGPERALLQIQSGFAAGDMLARFRAADDVP